ncbi:helix-turn-helix transcriptional regulator [Streptomyces albiaxialis]|uniref:Helix-turn-helix transcriptional regulator n=1 Tax=Streptomyces albiaxialis TaxID=329523 RepID=A0ABN2WN55_9ACTN
MEQPGQLDEGEGSGLVVAFGKQVKALRLRAGIEREEFGNRVGYSASTIASFEQGRRIPPERFIDRADEVLGADGVLTAMKEQLRQAQYPAFFRDAARLEARAVAVHVYAVYGMPGLLQTEDHARAVFGMWRPLLGEETLAQRVEARLARQEIFSWKQMPTLSFVVEESVLRRPIGGRHIMRAQLEHVLLQSHQRNVEIQVMPTGREEHCGLGGPFTLIETRDGRRVAYVEVQGNSRLYTARTMVREFEEQYGILRAQALTPRESMGFIEKLLGEQ